MRPSETQSKVDITLVPLLPGQPREQTMTSKPVELHDSTRNIQQSYPSLDPTITVFIILDGPARDFLVDVVRNASCYVPNPSQSSAPRNQVVPFGASYKPSVFLVASLYDNLAKVSITVMGKAVLSAAEIQCLAAIYKQHVQAQALKVLSKREASPSRVSLPRTQRFASPNRRTSPTRQVTESHRPSEPTPAARNAWAVETSLPCVQDALTRQASEGETRAGPALMATKTSAGTKPGAVKQPVNLADPALNHVLGTFTVQKHLGEGLNGREAYKQVCLEFAGVVKALSKFEYVDYQELSQYQAEPGNGVDMLGNDLSKLRVYNVPGRFKKPMFVVKTCCLRDYSTFKSFGNEVQAYRKLRNRSRILPLYAAGIDVASQKGWLVTPKMDSDMTVRCRALKTKLECTNLRIAIGVCKAVERMHEHGLLHLDLKPQNVFMQGLEPRLADFGTAIPIPDEPQRCPGATAMFAPPEVARLHKPGEKGHFGISADSYALALTVYLLLTGEFPLRYLGGDFSRLPDEKQLEILSACQASVSVRKWLPADLRAVFLGMLHYEPDNRPTPADLRAALETCLKEEEAALHATTSKHLGAIRAATTTKTAQVKTLQAAA